MAIPLMAIYTVWIGLTYVVVPVRLALRGVRSRGRVRPVPGPSDMGVWMRLKARVRNWFRGTRMGIDVAPVERKEAGLRFEVSVREVRPGAKVSVDVREAGLLRRMEMANMEAKVRFWLRRAGVRGDYDVVWVEGRPEGAKAVELLEGRVLLLDASAMRKNESSFREELLSLFSTKAKIADAIESIRIEGVKDRLHMRRALTDVASALVREGYSEEEVLTALLRYKEIRIADRPMLMDADKGILYLHPVLLENDRASRIMLRAGLHFGIERQLRPTASKEELFFSMFDYMSTLISQVYRKSISYYVGRVVAKIIPGMEVYRIKEMMDIASQKWPEKVRSLTMFGISLFDMAEEYRWWIIRQIWERNPFMYGVYRLWRRLRDGLIVINQRWRGLWFRLWHKVPPVEIRRAFETAV